MKRRDTTRSGRKVRNDKLCKRGAQGGSRVKWGKNPRVVRNDAL